MIAELSPETLERALTLLKAGELLGFPTETVYGLGADAANSKAVKKIFEAKGRPADHPVIVHIASKKNLASWANDIPDDAYKLANAFWPGPLTLILQRSSLVPNIVTGGQDTVGLRVPEHPVALTVLEAFGGGIAAPSANRFGRISPTTAQHVQEELGGSVQLILEGGSCEVGLESTIVDLSTGVARVLRPGGIRLQALTEVLGYEPELKSKTEIRTSGTLESHYAPQTPSLLVKHIPNDVEHVGVIARRPAPSQNAHWLELSQNAQTYARELYAALRKLDGLGLKQIYIEEVPDSADWLAVRDRLKRATFKETT
ncbi:MAG: threonylcarbamoyl-AMP synthase [Trueperaceae bacterium]|nr:threonylcarbamoyl-AMP synthase [Trueperaceae bacterium]